MSEVSLYCNYSFMDSNYSGTLTPTNGKRFSIFINNLAIYKSFQ